MAPVSLTSPVESARVARSALVRLLGLLAVLPLIAACTTVREQWDVVPVTALARPDGVLFMQGAQSVLFYRSRPAPGREPWRTNYVHPLYSIGGAVVTEDGPKDHLHQRGVYWAWRRILVDGVRVADGWVGEGLVLEVADPRTSTWPDGSAQLDVHVTWYAAIDGRQSALIEENSTIRAFPAVAGHRRVAFVVQLRALRPGVELAGTDDEKGYGGISLRFAHAEQVEIEGDGRMIHATLARMDAGRSVSFRWPSLRMPWPPRITVECAVDDEPWPQWVLRQEPSMQNCAYPGSRPVFVPEDRALILSAIVEIE